MNQITLPISELKPAIAGLSKVVGKKTTLPVLGAVRIDRDHEGWITITGTDLDSFASVRLEQPDNGPPTTILVGLGDLTQIVKSCAADDSITLHPAATDRVMLRYPIGNQQAERQVPSFPAEEFPPIPHVNETPITITDNVRASVLEAMQCASTDETRAVLCGAYLDVSRKDAHHVIATDGRHLYSSNSFVLPMESGLLIPDCKFIGWKGFADDGEWRLTRQREKETSYGQLNSRRWKFIWREMEGTYPNWRQVIPNSADSKTTLSLSVESAASILKLIPKIPGGDVTNHTIGLKIETGKLALRGRNSDSDPWIDLEIIGATVTGKAVTVYLNRKFLSKALEFGLREVHVIDPLSPLRFQDGGRQMVVMPIRADSVNGTTPVEPAPAAAKSNANGAASGSCTAGKAVAPEGAEQKDTPNVPRNSGDAATSGTKSSLEAAGEHLEKVKSSYREVIRGLADLGNSLKQAQREQKVSDREVQSVRATLEKLQSVRI